MSDPDLEFETALRTTLLDRAAHAPDGGELADTVTRLGYAGRRRRRLAAGGTAVILAGALGIGLTPFTGDGDAEPEPADDPTIATPEPTPTPVAMDGPITCLPLGWPAFDPALLTDRPPLDPASDLGQVVSSEAPQGSAPVESWTLVGQDGATVHALAWLTNGAAQAVSYEQSSDGSWIVVSDSECVPQLAFDDELWPAEWTVPGEPPGPDATSIEIQVQSEFGCFGDLAADGRLAEPVVDYHDDAVLITPRIRPLTPETYDCPLTRPGRLTVELAEPLGDRQLLDGRWYPARPVPQDPAGQP